jgi:cytochrome c556
MQRKGIGILAGVLVALGAAMPVVADTTPEDAKDYRAAVMTAFRGHIGAASMIVRGLVDNNGQLLSHAEALASTAVELKNLFPEGSAVGESEALPAIWEKPDEFAEAVDAMVEATVAFEEAAADGDPEAIGAAFRQVGMSCRGCHDNFRKSD